MGASSAARGCALSHDRILQKSDLARIRMPLSGPVGLSGCPAYSAIAALTALKLPLYPVPTHEVKACMLPNPNNQMEASAEPIESVSVEAVALMPIPEYVAELVAELVGGAKVAAGRLATLSTSVKNQALLAMAEALEEQKDTLLSANELDLAAFGTAPEKKAMADRLRLTDKRVSEMAAGLREVAALPDPLGEMPKMWTRPNGMQVGRVRVPIGVIGIIYESRPNVTAGSAGLCLQPAQ